MAARKATGSPSRSRSAASSGASTLRCTPVPISRPASWARRGITSMRQQKRSASRGAVRTHMLSGGSAPSAAPRRLSASCSSRAAERAVVGEARRGPARDDLHVERHARAEGTERHRLGVDRHDALAPAHLLLHHVLEQVAALGAVGVGGEALALARHRGGHEGQRVELRVRVRQRGARLPALVHDHVHVRRARVLAHALAPDRHRRLHLLGRQLGQRVHRVGRVHDHLVRAHARAVRRTGRARRGRRPAGRPRARPRPARARGRGSAPRARASRASRARRRPRAARTAPAGCGPRGRRQRGRPRGRSGRAERDRARRPGAARARRPRSRAGPTAGRCAAQVTAASPSPRARCPPPRSAGRTPRSRARGRGASA